MAASHQRHRQEAPPSAGYCCRSARLVGLADGRRSASHSSPTSTARRTCSASLYDLIGNPEAAAGVRNGMSDQVFAKLVLAAVALAAGVGGIWLLYAGLSALVEPLRPARSGAR